MGCLCIARPVRAGAERVERTGVFLAQEQMCASACFGFLLVSVSVSHWQNFLFSINQIGAVIHKQTDSDWDRDW